MFRTAAAIAAALLTFIFFTVPASAGDNGVVRGDITVDGHPASGALVTLEGEGSKFTAKTKSDGSYVFDDVPFGSYRVIAHVDGAHDLQSLVTVASDSVATVNIPLTTKLTEIAHTTVTALGTGASSNPPSVHQLDKNFMQTSPVNNSLDKLVNTLPGVVPFSYNEPVINGFHGVMYNIDGAPLPLATTSNFAEIVDPKNIDSVELLTGAIPAEYGGDRMGGVINIITNRPTDIPEGIYGAFSGGFGNQNQGIGEFQTSARFGSTEAFLNANTQSTSRGLDAPTLDPIHDDSSQSDQFFRTVTQLSPTSTVAFDYSNQLAQFQIPINVDPNNPYDPIFYPAGTDDVQREYDRFSNLTFTQQYAGGNGVWQLIPWWRSTRINYDGDLPNDVQGIIPPFGADAVIRPDDSSSSGAVNAVGLLSNTYAAYVGLRASNLYTTETHAFKVGIDVSRENLLANQAFGCYYPDCGATGVHDQPYYLVVSPEQAQAGSQVAAYVQDEWKMGKFVQVNYGLRYDHSTGYTSGNMIEPRIGVNVWDGGRNVAHVYYGRFYAAPLLEDVRQDCVVLQGCSGTPVYDLKPEQDAYFETGVKHTFNSSLTGSLNVFRKTSVNILDTTQLLNTPLFAVFNNAIGIDNGAELRLDARMPTGDTAFFTMTYSGSYAACVSGSTFLFPPDVNPPNQSCVSQLAPEDHDETVVSSAAYTHRFGGNHKPWFATLQANYGSGFPVAFEDANANLSGRLPAHTTFDLAAGRVIVPGRPGEDQGFGISLQVLNLLNHQYPIKVANGFNTTQIANGTSVLLRLTAPF